MSQLAKTYHDDFAVPFGLATAEVTESPDLPRWAKVLQATQNLESGAYDRPASIEAMLDGCMDRLLDDVVSAD